MTVPASTLNGATMRLWLFIFASVFNLSGCGADVVAASAGVATLQASQAKQALAQQKAIEAKLQESMAAVAKSASAVDAE